jgi:hypothetical protein
MGARNVMPRVPIVPATNEPMAAVASAAPARPVAGHLVALERRDDGGAFARGVEQDRGGRAAIHGAVIDAGEQMKAAVGSTLKVIGRSSAIVSAGP